MPVPIVLPNRSASTSVLLVRTKGALSVTEISVDNNAVAFAIVAHSVDVNRPIDETWCKIGDFADAGRFLNVSSKLVSGNGQIGSVRIVGDSILEVMVGSSRYSYTYAQVHGPMAALWYHGCLELSSLWPRSCRLTYTLIYDQTTLDGARRSSEFERITLRFQSAAQSMKVAAEASREQKPTDSS
jgi:hypothetical protein